MISLAELEETWALLRSLKQQGTELRVRELAGVSTSEGNALCGLDSDNLRHVLFPVESGSRIREDRRSGGIVIASRTLLDQGSKRSFVDVACKKAHLAELFSSVVLEMLELVDQGSERPGVVCHQVLERWRELLERELNRRPSVEQLVGVYGELWHLRELVKLNGDAVSAWQGPKDGLHDFVAGASALEIKASRSRHGRVFQISGHRQLEPPEGGSLHLGAMKVEEIEKGGESLGELIASIGALGADRALLTGLLAGLGLDSEALRDLSGLRLRVLENRIYEVDDGFPRITSGTFSAGALPAGIVKITYWIDLANEPPRPLDPGAVEALYGRMAGSLRG